MVLYMDSIALYLNCLFIKFKEKLCFRNLNNLIHVYRYYAKEIKDKHILLALGRVLDHAFPSNLLYYHLATSI